MFWTFINLGNQTIKISLCCCYLTAFTVCKICNFNTVCTSIVQNFIIPLNPPISDYCTYSIKMTWIFVKLKYHTIVKHMTLVWMRDGLPPFAPKTVSSSVMCEFIDTLYLILFEWILQCLLNLSFGILEKL